MDFQVKKASREKIYAKIALMAPSGGGKTYSALRLATGMAEEIKETTGKDAKILFGNTEKKRGYYYANEFNYDIVDINAPHEPEKYVDLINYAVKKGYDILIIDSSSHEWEGIGGCLELHKKAGGRYQDWDKVTPRHNKFIDAIAESNIHIIATMRGKDQYVMTQTENKNGNGTKTTVEKLGVGAKQRDGFEYEFSCTFLLDQKTNTAEPFKDNTHIFENEPCVKLTEEHGKKIIKWANISDHSDTNELQETINQIGVLAKTLATTKREEVMAAITKHFDSPDYRKITDINVAKAVLNELNLINN